MGLCGHSRVSKNLATIEEEGDLVSLAGTDSPSLADTSSSLSSLPLSPTAGHRHAKVSIPACACCGVILTEGAFDDALMLFSGRRNDEFSNLVGG